MRQGSVLCQIGVLLLFALVVSAASQAQDKAPAGASSTAQTLMALEDKWVDALQKMDTATLDSILADTYVDSDEQGHRSDKKGIMAVLKAGDLKFESVKVSDMEVHSYGSAAVVTGTGVQRGTFKGGPLITRVIFTDTFIRQNGKWRAVSSHRSAAP